MTRAGSLNNFEEIEEELKSLEYSEDSIVELISLLNRAIEIAIEKNPNRHSNPCLNNLVQTHEKQTKELIVKDLTEDVKEERFNDAKTAFRMDFMFCRRM